MHPLLDSCFPLALGTSGFGTSIARDTAFSVLDAFLDCGGRLVDTAAVYGMGVSEQVLGDWMKSRGVRERMIVATKGGHPDLRDWSGRMTEREIVSDAEGSLRFLQTDCIDLYFLHRDDESKPVEVIMPILDRLVREGKVRHLGASNWRVARINEANAFAKKNGMTAFSVSQILWCGTRINREGLFDPTMVDMDEEEHRGYAENKLPVMAYSSQAQGLFARIREKGYEGLSERMLRTYDNPFTRLRAERILEVAKETGVSPSAVSLAYLLHDRAVKAYPILGTSRPERLREAMGVFSLKQRDVDRLFEVLQ